MNTENNVSDTEKKSVVNSKSLDEVKYLPGFDVLRVIACLGILFLHFSNYACPDGVYFGKFLLDPQGSSYDFNLFVEVFFALSGFFAYAYVGKIEKGLTFKRFFLPKVIRIVPMLIISTVVLEIALWQLVCSGNAQGVEIYKPSLWGMVSACFGFEYICGFDNANINRESWYIDLLLLCYIVLYLIIKVSKRKQLDWRWLCVFLSVGGSICVMQGWTIPFLGVLNGRAYAAFFIGLLLADYFTGRTFSVKHYVLAGTVLFVFAFLLVFYPDSLIYGKTCVVTYLVIPALFLSFRSDTVSKLLSFKLIKWISDVSYSTYLFHVTLIIVVFIVTDKLGFQIDYAHEVMLFFFWIVSFAFGGIAYCLVERPLTCRLNKIFSGEKK